MPHAPSDRVRLEGAEGAALRASHLCRAWWGGWVRYHLRKRHKDHLQMEEARRKAASETSGMEDGKGPGKFHRPSSARPK